MDELDYLAKRLDSFVDSEAAQFQGMAANVDLPTSVAEVHTIASALMPEWPIEIENVSGPIPNLTKYIRRANLESKSDVQSLNSLAQKIDRMSGAEHQLFSGALDAESINGLDDVLRIADSLDSYPLQLRLRSDQLRQPAP